MMRAFYGVLLLAVSSASHAPAPETEFTCVAWGDAHMQRRVDSDEVTFGFRACQELGWQAVDSTPVAVGVFHITD